MKSVDAVSCAIESMNVSLRREYTAIQRAFRDAATSDVLSRYRAGRRIAEIKRNRHKYGNDAVGILSAALGRDVTTLYRYAQVAERWPPAAIEAILQRRGMHGEPISWSHLVEIATERSKTRRNALVEEVLNRDLSVRALIRQMTGVSRPELEASRAYARYGANTIRAAARVAKWGSTLCQAAEQNPGAELLPLLARAIDAQIEARSACDGVARRLEAARRAIENASSRRALDEHAVDSREGELGHELRPV